MQSQTTNQTSQPNTEQSNSGDKFSNWWEFLHFLFTDKQGKRITGFLLGILVLSALSAIAAIYFLRPEKIEITTGFGTVAIKNGDTQNAAFLLSPNGGDENTPWVKTGIQVNKDDLIEITASGRVHPSQKRLIGVALKPRTIELTHIPWVSPNGLPKNLEFPLQENRSKAKLLPSKNGAVYGYGMLLAAIRDDNEQIGNIEPIGEEGKFTAENDGELVLTVNDIWLNGEKKNIEDFRDIYLLPFEENLQYYINEAKFEAVLREENYTTWNDDTKREKAKEVYQIREEIWNTIRTENNWNFFYEDNLGAFSVSIAVKPK